jgi:hypothetical protein
MSKPILPFTMTQMPAPNGGSWTGTTTYTYGGNSPFDATAAMTPSSNGSDFPTTSSPNGSICITDSGGGANYVGSVSVTSFSAKSATGNLIITGNFPLPITITITLSYGYGV